MNILTLVYHRKCGNKRVSAWYAVCSAYLTKGNRIQMSTTLQRQAFLVFKRYLIFIHVLRTKLIQLVQHLNIEWNYELSHTTRTQRKWLFPFYQNLGSPLPHMTPQTFAELMASIYYYEAGDLGSNESWYEKHTKHWINLIKELRNWHPQASRVLAKILNYFKS